MKTKEQLADEYEKDFPGWYDLCTQSFIAGYEKAEPKWISVSEQMPPKNIELLVKAPDGLIHLANWRESYNIFTCQNKDESSYDWQYMKIPQ